MLNFGRLGYLIMLFNSAVNNEVSFLFTLSENQETMVIGLNFVFLYQIFCLVLVISGNDICPQVFFFFQVRSGNEAVDPESSAGEFFDNLI